MNGCGGCSSASCRSSETLSTARRTGWVPRKCRPVLRVGSELKQMQKAKSSSDAAMQTRRGRMVRVLRTCDRWPKRSCRQRPAPVSSLPPPPSAACLRPGSILLAGRRHRRRLRLGGALAQESCLLLARPSAMQHAHWQALPCAALLQQWRLVLGAEAAARGQGAQGRGVVRASWWLRGRGKRVQSPPVV